MKLLKGSVLLLLLFAVTNISAQEITEKVKKKFGWIDKDKNGSIELAELEAFHDGKTNKKGETIDTELMFLGLDKDNNNKVSLELLAKGPDWKLAKQKVKAKKAD